MAIQLVPTALLLVVAGLLGLAELTSMDPAVKAPLYAIVAATGFAVAHAPLTDQKRERKRKLLVSSLTALAALASAYWWLKSVDAGVVIESVAALWLFIAVFVIVHNIEKSEQRLDDGEVVD